MKVNAGPLRDTAAFSNFVPNVVSSDRSEKTDKFVLLSLFPALCHIRKMRVVGLRIYFRHNFYRLPYPGKIL